MPEKAMETPITTTQVADRLGQMSVMELIELTRQLEAQWGVKAQPHVQVRQDQVPTVKEEAVEQTEFAVWLLEPGENRVAAIKAVREITGLGLKEAKDLVESAPKPLKEGLPKDEAQQAVAKLTEAKARAELR